MKKLVLFMIFAVAVVSLLVVGASAATEGTPIATVADFENINIAELASGQEAPKYYLANDIDFGGKEYDCFIVEKFSGVLDGNGHTIFNFKITGTQNSDHAIIKNLGGLADTTVKDLTIGKADNLVVVTPNALAAGKSHAVLAGAISNNAERAVTIQGVTIYADFNFAYTNKGNAGGFIGYAAAGQLLIEDCKFYGSFKYGDPSINSTEYMNAGGFIGAFKYHTGTFKNCENYADITLYPTLKEGRSAGIVGYTDGDLVFENCKNYGTISAFDFDDVQFGYAQSDSMCSGILGHLNKKLATLTNCVNYGTLYGSNRVGTMIAKITGDATTELATIKDCKNEGKLTSNALLFNGAYGESEGTPKVEGYTDVSTEKVEFTTLEQGTTTPYVEPDEPTTEATTTEKPADETEAPTDEVTTTLAPDDGTDAPDETTTAAPAEEKSCGGFAGAAAAIVAVVAILGCAVVIKTK